MAGLLIQLKPFVGQRRAANYSEREEQGVHRAQVMTALTWLKALFSVRASLCAVRHYTPPTHEAGGAERGDASVDAIEVEVGDRPGVAATGGTA